MSQDNDYVPPLPPRRSIPVREQKQNHHHQSQQHQSTAAKESVLLRDARLLLTVPPAPNDDLMSMAGSDQVMTDELKKVLRKSNCQDPVSFLVGQMATPKPPANWPQSTGGGYFQLPNNSTSASTWTHQQPQQQTLNGRHQLNSFSSFTNYSYIQPQMATARTTLTPVHAPMSNYLMSHSLSAPAGFGFNNPTYTYQPATTAAASMTLDDVKKLIKNGDSSPSSSASLVKKADNSDLIDLGLESSDDVLTMFDPLMSSEDNLPFKKQLAEMAKQYSESPVKRNGDEIDHRVVEEAEVEKKSDHKLAESSSSNSLTASSSSSSSVSVPVKDDRVLSRPLRVAPKKWRASEEERDFVEKLIAVRSQFLASDFNGNVGLVISPTLDSQRDHSLSVKLVIDTAMAEQPISFTCNVDTSIEHIVSHVICTLVEDASQVNMDDFILQVRGRSEYLAADSVLANYQYVHYCHKFDLDVYLTLVRLADVRRTFARTTSDDEDLNRLSADDLLPEAVVCRFGELTTSCINILLETFDREVAKLRTDAKNGCNHLQPLGINQTIKAICSQLSSIESIELTEASNNLTELCRTFCAYKRDSFKVQEELGSEWAVVDQTSSITSMMANIPDLDLRLCEVVDHALIRVREAISQLVDLYSRTFPVEFEIEQDEESSSPKKGPRISLNKPRKDVSPSMDTLIVHVAVCNQLPVEWLSIRQFIAVVQLWHGDHRLAEVKTKPVSVTRVIFPRLLFNEWVQFDLPMNDLPRETRLQVMILGLKNGSEVSPPPSPAPTAQEPIEPAQTLLAVAVLPIFNHRLEMAQGTVLVPMITDSSLVGQMTRGTPSVTIPLSSVCKDRNAPMIQLQMPVFDSILTFPSISPLDKSTPPTRHRLSSLDSATQTEIHQLLNGHHPLEPMKGVEKEQLWDRRNYLVDLPSALSKVLLAGHQHIWQSSSLHSVYSLINSWSTPSPVEAMQLLLPSLPDIHLRQMVIKWLKRLSQDELADFLPQLVEAIRHDTYLWSPIFEFLLESSLTNVRVCHSLYWQLKEHVHDPTFGYRARVYINSLLSVCGKATQSMVDKQEQLCGHLSQVSECVKSAKESHRLSTMQSKLQIVDDFLRDNNCVLPLSPSMAVVGLDIKMCSYYTSNTLPLKLVFRCPHTKSASSTLEAIYKVGDDLRQDQLTIQMIRIMDKLWLKDGLDLRMVTFDCVATEHRKGMVEMVVNSETLRKIQLEHGLTGSFKDRPIAEWLKKHNDSELKYYQAVDNFTHSCAGYVVATYILGICDRHNDNIMLTTSGHLFHIDFGKFLGDSQMMAGAIKRDRVPFVLTSDMAFVINGGDKPSKQFQSFVEICCQAFNIIRKNSNLLMALFSLMMASRISGLSGEAMKYVHQALMPGFSEVEAMAQFTRLIEDSLRSKFTQFNFFIHNLAQLRFTGDHNDQLLISFVPKTFTKETDGKIKRLDVVEVIKNRDPEKVYYYRIKVERHNEIDPSFVYRSYREFVEFHDKLVQFYPLARFHSLTRSSQLIRSNTRDVANQRAEEISYFIRKLMGLAEEISHCDLVYTFFHPILRDHEGLEASSKRSVTMTTATGATQKFLRDQQYAHPVPGQVKLSMVYKNASLVLMVMHAKNLQSHRTQTPDCYVKTYLLPDATKHTKRKTRIIRNSCHPTFMEMIVYQEPMELLQEKRLQVSVWDYDRVAENVFIGAANINLRDVNLRVETVEWYTLTGQGT